MGKTAKRFIISIIFLVSAFAANAQIDKEFWFCVPQITAQHEFDEPKIYITNAGEEPASVVIEMPLESGFSKLTKTILPHTQEGFNLKTYFTKDESDGDKKDMPNIIESGLYGESCIVTNKGIHITSDNLISVYLERGKTNNDDIWALKGKNAFGTYFIIPAQTDFMNRNFNTKPDSSPSLPNHRISQMKAEARRRDGCRTRRTNNAAC